MSSSPYNPTASYYKFVLIGNLLSTFILQFSYGATHLRQAVIDESLIEVVRIPFGFFYCSTN